jgi:hypothetical protein
VQHSCEIRRHNPIGDIITITGRVRAIAADDAGQPRVEVEQRAVNQGGELSATGVGVVRLPARNGTSAAR